MKDMNKILFNGKAASELLLSDAIVNGILPVPVYINILYDQWYIDHIKSCNIILRRLSIMTIENWITTNMQSATLSRRTEEFALSLIALRSSSSSIMMEAAILNAQEHTARRLENRSVIFLKSMHLTSATTTWSVLLVWEWLRCKARRAEMPALLYSFFVHNFHRRLR